ncbi:Hypothetical protein CINCED_3A004094 [Cinara cedri]|uniref:Uncharacterized protein n=1 Tax=Cinara cedri TaxID=506608 RepID=A0A5E4MXY9_9HEMI|nr:Hypothetical protein CINCED_3A004094 [Cinara cedri]
MDSGTVALLQVLLATALSSWHSDTAVVTATAFDGGATGLFGYPDDDHVIITQYGPMRYKPVTADEMNRPYDGGGPRGAAGHYKAEVIPLDIKTWKPMPGNAGGSGGGWVGRGAVGGSGRSEDFFDVPLRVGYTVRPVTTSTRRRRHDYYLMAAGYPSQSQPPPSPSQYLHRYHPGIRLPPPPQPPPAALLWRY